MKFNKIFNAFPPPKFLDIPFAGLSISDSAVRVVQFSKKRGKLSIQKHGEKTLSPGVVTSGQINNKDELVKVIQDLKKELNLDYVRVSLPEEKAYLFTAKIPVVGKKEVRSAIESKIEENVPVPPGELTFDYRLFYHKEKEHLDVVVSNLPISVVQTYVDIIQNSNLSLLSLEIESQAIIRSVVHSNSLGTVLIINFGPEKVGLYVASFGVVRFTSTVQIKGNFTKDNMENNQGLLLQELKKLNIYWHTLKENIDKPDMQITQIIVCGENFDESIVTYLSSHNSTPVVMGNVWVNAFDVNKEVPDISFNDSLRFAGAVGLALPNDILI